MESGQFGLSDSLIRKADLEIWVKDSGPGQPLGCGASYLARCFSHHVQLALSGSRSRWLPGRP